MIKKFFQSLVRRLKRDDVASGKTPPGPRRKAHRSGHEPKIVIASQHNIDLRLVSHVAIRVVQDLQNAGFKAFIVGGAVRDLLLGVKPKDFDVATNAEPEQVQKLFRRARIIGRRFRLVHVMQGPEVIEVSTFRAIHTDDVETDEHGRVLRDNAFGDQHEDAARRDFTINALYFDPISQVVLDYHDGVADLRARRLRMIGDPAKRYREDPVRMLRAVRFAAKLKIEIDPATAEPIRSMANLIDHVPSARLFDEMLKLLVSGHSLACIQTLRTFGLDKNLLPGLGSGQKDETNQKFVELALAATDARLAQGKPISPGFLFACLLWHTVKQGWDRRMARGEHRIPALNAAIDQVFEQQNSRIAVQRRYLSDMREIWLLQPRFERRRGAAPYRLLEQPRLRAGMDFLLLRSEAGEMPPAFGLWWKEFIESDPGTRERLIEQALAQETEQESGGRSSKPRQRPRRSKARAEGGSEPDQASQGSAATPSRAPAHEAGSNPDAASGDGEAPKRRRRPRRPKRAGAPAGDGSSDA